MKKNKVNNRSRILINPRFQLVFIGVMLVSAIFVIGTTFVANFFFFRKFSQLGIDLKFSADHDFFQFLNHQQTVMAKIFAVDALLTFSFLMALGLVFSHRIAGPLYKLHKHLLNAANKNKYSNVQFRKNDFFQEIAEAYNQQLPEKKGLGNKSHGNKEKKAA